MVDLTKKVVCAANRHPQFGFVVCGARHYDKAMCSTIAHLHPDYHEHTWEQGFINTWGEFLTREEAWVVAVANKQIIKLVGNQTEKDLDEMGAKLYSENLY